MDQIARFADPLSLLIVVGGALLVAAIRSTRDDLARAFAALVPLFRADPQADSYAAMRAVGAIEKLAEVRGISCADRIETAGVFLRRAAFRLADSASAEAFALWADDDLAARGRRHQGAIGFWRAMADGAPAMGMIGTVIGLIQMFAAMADVDGIGPAMALAMLTTLYGIVLSGAIAGPIAARLERLSEAELAWQRWTLDRLSLIARAELEATPAAVAASRARLRTVS